MRDSSAGRLRPLNRPRPVRVEADDGFPLRVRLDGRWRTVTSTLEAWRVDDEWWRAPISRAYFAVVLDEARHIVLYRDLATGEWRIQSE
ncbi:MAG: hypothetical protein ACRELC_01090 [Gemmatimonadota bacterium]